MKRGLGPPWVHAAFAITRRRGLQLSSVAQRNSLNRRAAARVWRLAASARASPVAMAPSSRTLRARPKT